MLVFVCTHAHIRVFDAFRLKFLLGHFSRFVCETRSDFPNCF